VFLPVSIGVFVVVSNSVPMANSYMVLVELEKRWSGPIWDISQILLIENF
jgi:hypothetical protein